MKNPANILCYASMTAASSQLNCIFFGYYDHTFFRIKGMDPSSIAYQQKNKDTDKLFRDCYL